MGKALKYPTHGPDKFNRKRHCAKISEMGNAARSAKRQLSMTPEAIRLREQAEARKVAGLPSTSTKKEKQKKQDRQQLM
jgi:hypothetical protein